MCGFDNIYYEHMIYGGDNLLWALINLFSAMLTHGYVPPNMNRGEIITLYKGGGKRKDDPQNYRAITLTSTILKLFESTRGVPKIMSLASVIIQRKCFCSF